MILINFCPNCFEYIHWIEFTLNKFANDTKLGLVDA